MRSVYLLAICTALLSGTVQAVFAADGVLPDQQVVSKTITGHSARHSFVLQVIAGPFRRQKHHLRVIEKNSDPDEATYWIDGKPEDKPKPKSDTLSQVSNWFGTDGNLPYAEFYSFEVNVDGRAWNFPKRLWQDCYEPHFPTGPKGEGPSARLSKDGNRLTIKSAGGDGAGFYEVIWRLRKQGTVTRGVGAGDGRN